MMFASKIAGALVGALVLTCAAFAPVAQAAPFSQTLDFNPDVLITSSNSKSYQHSILGSGFVVGDTINSATLSINVYDGQALTSENGIVNIEGSVYPQGDVSFFGETWTFSSGSFTALVTALADGLLNVTISTTSGSFYLDSSSLSGTYTHNNVPEPATLFLLGGALTLLGFRRRATS